MYCVNELLGLPLQHNVKEHLRRAQCPYMRAVCDGGGNRNMARLPNDHALASLFDPDVLQEGDNHISCGICSVKTKKEKWAICSRRLLAFPTDGNFAETQKKLVQKVLTLAGFSLGDQVRVWSEVTIKEKGFNYRMDYILRGINPDDPPIIVEVMTASTSGGNKNKGSDIASAFSNAILYAGGLRGDPGESPGVNKRQVWARMASQVIVKSQAANNWGGRTIWVIQNELLEYMRENTGLPLEKLQSSDWKPQEVNIIVADMDDPTGNNLAFYAGPIRAKNGGACWLELLTAKRVPTFAKVHSVLEAAKPIAILKAP